MIDWKNTTIAQMVHTICIGELRSMRTGLTPL